MLLLRHIGDCGRLSASQRKQFQKARRFPGRASSQTVSGPFPEMISDAITGRQLIDEKGRRFGWEAKSLRRDSRPAILNYSLQLASLPALLPPDHPCQHATRRESDSNSHKWPGHAENGKHYGIPEMTRSTEAPMNSKRSQGGLRGLIPAQCKR